MLKFAPSSSQRVRYPDGGNRQHRQPSESLESDSDHNQVRSDKSDFESDSDISDSSSEQSTFRRRTAANHSISSNYESEDVEEVKLVSLFSNHNNHKEEEEDNEKESKNFKKSKNVSKKVLENESGKDEDLVFFEDYMPSSPALSESKKDRNVDYKQLVEKLLGELNESRRKEKTPENSNYPSSQKVESRSPAKKRSSTSTTTNDLPTSKKGRKAATSVKTELPKPGSHLNPTRYRKSLESLQKQFDTFGRKLSEARSLLDF